VSLFLLAVFTLGLTLWINSTLFLGIMKMEELSSTTPTLDIGGDHPRVSIIVPACNEEKTIEQGLLSMLAQDYDNLEIVAIDDRSTDATFQVISSLSEVFSKLKIHQITELPEGWLGKSHALNYGANLATGDYLIFTDADIHMDKSTVARAVAYMLENEVDHLSLVFRNMAPGTLLNSMVLDGGANLLLLFQPWNVHDADSRHFVGVGAFNMVKSKVYRNIEGHSSIRMHPVDDIMLGKIIKKNGFSQQCLLALEFLTVRWYESVTQMINGLMKNVFSLFHYQVAWAVMAVFLSVLINIVPLWGALFSVGLTRVLFLLTVAIRLLAFSFAAKRFKVTYWCVPGSLVSPYINIYITVKATYKTLKDRGIYWRATFYPLWQLKKSQQLFC